MLPLSRERRHVGGGIRCILWFGSFIFIIIQEVIRILFLKFVFKEFIYIKNDWTDSTFELSGGASAPTVGANGYAGMNYSSNSDAIIIC